MYRTDFWTLLEKARVGCFKRTALKHVYYLGWNRSPAQVGCIRQALRFGALGRPRGIGWRGNWEGGSGWGTHVNPWLIHFNVWQNPLQYCKVISLQVINTHTHTHTHTRTRTRTHTRTHKKKKEKKEREGGKKKKKIPGRGRFAGEGNRNWLQYSCLENPKDGGA